MSKDEAWSFTDSGRLVAELRKQEEESKRGTLEES